MEPTSSTQELWIKFLSTVSDFMYQYLSIKIFSGKKV